MPIFSSPKLFKKFWHPEVVRVVVKVWLRMRVVVTGEARVAVVVLARTG